MLMFVKVRDLKKPHIGTVSLRIARMREGDQRSGAGEPPRGTDFLATRSAGAPSTHRWYPSTSTRMRPSGARRHSWPSRQMPSRILLRMASAV